MPVTVQIDGVGKVQLDDSFNGLSQADQQATVDEIANHHAASAPVAAPPGPPPSIVDRVVASPIGRGIHNLAFPLGNMEVSAVHVLEDGSSPDAPIRKIGGYLKSVGDSAEGAYQGALARNRNTPGYAAARAQADKVAANPNQPGGFSSSVTAPLNPVVAGITGLIAGGLDTSNAAADAQTAKQTKYGLDHPVLSGVGNLVGGAMLGPTAELRPPMPKQTVLPPLGADTAPVAAQQASQYVAKLATAAGKSPADLAGAAVDAAGKPVTAAEAIGKPGTVGLAALARRSGATPDVLQGLLDERAAGAPGRVMSDYASASGIDPTAAKGDIDALVSAGRAKASPLYEQAFAGGSTAPFEEQLRSSLSAATGAKGQIAKQLKDIETNSSNALASRGAAGADVRAKYMDLHQQLNQAEADRQATLSMFQQAKSDAANKQGAVWNPRIQQFLDDPIMKQGISRGLEVQRLESLAAGKQFNPSEFAVTSFDEAGKPVVGSVPNMRLLDAGKRGLDEIINDFRDPTTGKLVMNERVKALIGVKNSYLKELDAVNPNYAKARSEAGDYLSASSAFNRGQKAILDPNLSAADFANEISSHTPANLEALKGGVANKLFNLAQNNKLDPKVFNRPIVQQKLSALLGPEKAQVLLKNIKLEATMAESAGRMRPGAYSPTQELNAAMKEQDGTNGGINLALDAGKNVFSHGLAGGAVKTLGQYAEAPLSFLRTRGMSVPARDEAGRLLMLTPSELAKRLASTPKPQAALRLPMLTNQSRVPYGLLGPLSQQQNQ